MMSFRKSWNLSRKQRSSPQRLRRLFVEPLEGRRLLAADLEVIKDPPVGTLTAGSDISYKIRLNNIGADPADTVRLEDLIPANTTYVSFTDDLGLGFVLTTPPTSPDRVSAEIASLGAGAQAEFTLTVTIVPGTPAGTPISNTATASTITAEDSTTNNQDTEDAAVAPSADLSVTKTDDPADTVLAGTPITYTIDVTNNGPDAAENVSFSDFIPVNTTFVSLVVPAGWTRTDGVAVGGTGELTATNPSFAPGTSTFTLTVNVNAGAPGNATITNTATVASPTSDPNPGNESGTATTTVQAAGGTVDLTVAKTDTPDPVSAGGDLTYTITVTNGGTGAANTVELSDPIPTNTTLVSFTPPAGWTRTDTVPAGGTGTVSATNPSLAPATPAVFTLVVRVNPTTASGINITNIATATTTSTDTNPLDNTVIAQTAVQTRADLSVTKTDLPDPATAGSNLTYTITVNNIGPSNAQTVLFSDAIPSGTTFVSLVVPAGWTRTDTVTVGGTGTLMATNPSLAPNAPAVFTLVVNVNANVPAGPTAISNTATVSTTTTDPVAANNSDTETTAVQTRADLSVTKIDAPDPVVAGSNLTYTITVNNLGPSVAQSVSLSDAIPTNTTFVSFVAPLGWTRTDTVTVGGTGTIMVNTPSLATGAPAVFTLVVNVNASTPPGPTAISNTATVATATTDPVAGNNADTETTAVTPPPGPDLSVTKTDSPDPVTAGNNLTYTITVNNTGGAAAANVSLSDAIPSNTTFVSFTAPAGWTRTDTVAVGGTGTITATNPSLAAAGTATFTLIVKVNSSAAGGSSISNTASATTSGADPTPANNTDTETTAVVAQTDLSVAKSDSPDPVDAGSNLTYTITLTNAGPSDAQSVSLSDLVPANTTFVSLTSPPGWTAATPPVGGTGTVTATRASLAAAATATFTLVVNVNATTADGSTITNTATAVTTTPDPNAGNNSDTETTTARSARDFGDAPASYGTLLADNGARHVLSSPLRLGAFADFEANGQPSGTANGDDLAGIPDDEDGVLVPAGLIPSAGGAAIVTASAAGRLDAWIDFNRNGVFEASESIAANLPVVAGANRVAFTVPSGAAIGGTFARFRLSSAGGLAPTGQAADGEVEDYATSIIAVAPGSIGVIPDPENPGQQLLGIAGTGGNDRIVVEQLRTHLLQVRVTFNGRARGTFSMTNFRRIVVVAGAGNDTVDVKVGRPAMLVGEGGNDTLTSSSGFDQLFGGPGNDTLSAGGGSDLLLGGEGNDTLRGGEGSDQLFGEGGKDSLFGDGGADLLLGGFGDDLLSGGRGRDVLIGGSGKDRLAGDQDDDLLIGGNTAHDANAAALAALLAGWSSNASFETRINRLRSSLNPSTVFNDGARDQLDGGSERDWLIDFTLSDSIVHLVAGKDRKN